MSKNYDDLIKMHGDSPLGLGWGKKDRRNIRFEVLTEPWNLMDASVLDIGCGFGDLLGYLDAKGNKVQYTGFDNSVKALEIAKAKYPTGEFQLFDIENLSAEKRMFDYIFASGIFNDRREESLDFIGKVLKETNRMARQGFSLNFLSSTASIRYLESEYTAANEIARICQEHHLRFQINHFYMPFEFTLHVSKKVAFNPDSIVYDDYFGA